MKTITAKIEKTDTGYKVECKDFTLTASGVTEEYAMHSFGKELIWYKKKNNITGVFSVRYENSLVKEFEDAALIALAGLEKDFKYNK